MRCCQIFRAFGLSPGGTSVIREYLIMSNLHTSLPFLSDNLSLRPSFPRFPYYISFRLCCHIVQNDNAVTIRKESTS